MKMTLFLNDETVQTRLLLENTASAEVSLRETEAVAGCNCDRWGHPFPGCGHPHCGTKSGASVFTALGRLR